MYKCLCVMLILSWSFSVNAQHKKKKRKTTSSQSYKKKKRKKSVKPDIDLLAYEKSSNPIEQVFFQSRSFYQPFLSDTSAFRIQILFTQIDRDIRNVPTLKTYTFRLNPKEYFYPASAVKLPLCALTLEKLQQLQIAGLDRNTPLTVDSIVPCETPVKSDSTGWNSEASLGHFIRKILLVSDNDSYNRLYEFIGPEHIHKRMAELGMPNARIVHRFIPCTDEENTVTNPFTFYRPDGEILYRQPSQIHQKLLGSPLGEILMGKGYYDFNRKYIRSPKDFTLRNQFSLSDIDQTLKRLIIPEIYMPHQRFQIAEGDYRFLRRYMSMMPQESKLPTLGKPYFACQKKYLYYGQSADTTPDSQLRIFNIVGFSYGFLTDVAYLVDFNSQTECFISAVIYVNENEIFNDGIEEYYTRGMPFLKKLGQDLMNLERHRPKKHLPNLDAFRFDYGGVE